MKNNKTETVQVVKSVNEELKQATFVVMVPDEVDLHGDIIAEDEVRKACHNFNKHCNQANLFHITKTATLLPILGLPMNWWFFARRNIL